MPYNKNHVPDAPMTPGMLPRASTLHDSDFVILIQPVNKPGKKSRTATLSQLAAFLAGGGIYSITFTNANGFVATASDEGFNYHKNATFSDQAIRDYAIDSDGAHVSVTTPNYTKKFETDGTKAVITKTESGLVDKVEVFENYIQISHQTRNGANVITHTSRIAWDNMRTPEVRVMQDENNYIPISWDSANSEFVIWQRANSGTVAVPKLHVYGTLRVEKDTTIDADVVITKSMTVAGRTELNGNFTVIKNLYATEHTELKGISKLEMDMTSGAVIKCSSTPNPTLPNDAAVGTRIIVLNDTESNQTVTFGGYVLTLNGHTAAEFLHATSDTDFGWYKMT